MKTNKQNSEQRSLLIKAGIVTAFVLLMLIPISWLKMMINERKSTTEHMVKDVENQWGENQTVRGPLLVLPILNVSNEIVTNAYFAPEELSVVGDIKPTKVSKGIVDATCYESNLKISGTFKFPNIAELDLRNEQIAWDKAYFILELTSLNGIKNKVSFNINNEALELFSNSNTKSDKKQIGLIAKFPIDISNKQNSYVFNINLDVNGMDSLMVLPMGKHTTMKLKSDWKNVTYIGNFLPNTSDKSIAKWEIFDYNRNYTPMSLDKDLSTINNDVIGVELSIPIGHYEKIMRSVKYAVLFIVLTFTVFFMIEILTKKRIHPIQYLLVSFALMMFYTLLLAFSEHVGFDIAYIIAAPAVIIMITAYSKSVLRNVKQVLFITTFLIALYVYLYVVVQSENMSLLFGSIGLFIVLAIVMYTSRNVDWYAVKESKEKDLKNEPEFRSDIDIKEDIIIVDEYEVDDDNLNDKI